MSGSSCPVALLSSGKIFLSLFELRQPIGLRSVPVFKRIEQAARNGPDGEDPVAGQLRGWCRGRIEAPVGRLRPAAAPAPPGSDPLCLALFQATGLALVTPPVHSFDHGGRRPGSHSGTTQGVLG